MSSTVRSVFSGGNAGSGAVNVMDYVTIASTGNATDFGNLTVARTNGAAVNSTTRGIVAVGDQSGTNITIDYITIASAGYSTDFGNLTAADTSRVAIHSSTVAFFNLNLSDQITMATAGNATSSGFSIARDMDSKDFVMPGWLAYNG